jgi:hypothetical protein
VDELIEVEAGVDGQGRVQPKSFFWEGQRHPVQDVGRRWLEAGGEHLLVMTPGGQTWELAHSGPDGGWRLIRKLGPDRPSLA